MYTNEGTDMVTLDGNMISIMIWTKLTKTDSNNNYIIINNNMTKTIWSTVGNYNCTNIICQLTQHWHEFRWNTEC